MSGYTALYMVAWAQAGRRKSDVFRWFDRTSWASWSQLKGRDIELGGWAQGTSLWIRVCNFHRQYSIY